MDLEMIKKVFSIVATVIPVGLAVVSGVAYYLDYKYVPNKEYQTRQDVQERLVQQIKIESAINILENRRLILEEKLVVLNLCSSIPSCVTSFSGTEGLRTARSRTERELQDIRSAQAEWRKQKNTP